MAGWPWESNGLFPFAGYSLAAYFVSETSILMTCAVPSWASKSAVFPLTSPSDFSWFSKIFH